MELAYKEKQVPYAKNHMATKKKIYIPSKLLS